MNTDDLQPQAGLDWRDDGQILHPEHWDHVQAQAGQVEKETRAEAD